MLVVYGFYRFAQKQIGYRNDFCLTCNTERLTQQWRSFNCGHLFWIPLLPFGFFKRWICPTCNSNPHARTKSSKGFKIFAAVMFVLFTILGLVGAIATLSEKPTPEHPTPGDPTIFWGMAGVFGLASVALIRWNLSHEEPEDLTSHLRQVQPARTDVCPYCNSKLTSEQFCQSCKLQRHEVTLP